MDPPHRYKTRSSHRTSASTSIPPEPSRTPALHQPSLPVPPRIRRGDDSDLLNHLLRPRSELYGTISTKIQHSATQRADNSDRLNLKETSHMSSGLRKTGRTDMGSNESRPIYPKPKLLELASISSADETGTGNGNGTGKRKTRNDLSLSSNERPLKTQKTLIVIESDEEDNQVLPLKLRRPMKLPVPVKEEGGSASPDQFRRQSKLIRDYMAQSSIDLKEKAKIADLEENLKKIRLEHASALSTAKHEHDQVMKKVEEQHHAEMQQKNRILDILRQKLAGKEEDCSRVAALEGDNMKLKTELATLEAEKTRLEVENNKPTEECTKLKEESARIKEVSNKLEEESARLKEESFRLKEDSSRLKEDSSRLKEESARLMQENSRLKDESTKLKDESTKLKDENTKLKDENTKLKDENTKLKDRAKISNSELKSKAGESLEPDTEESILKIEKLTNSLKSLREELCFFKKENEGQEQRIEAHKSERRTIKAENTKLSKEVQSLKVALNKATQPKLQQFYPAQTPDSASGPVSPPPTPSTFPGSSMMSEQTKADNMREVLLRMKRKYDTMRSACKGLASTTQGLDVNAFGRFGFYVGKIRTILEEEEEAGSKAEQLTKKKDDGATG